MAVVTLPEESKRQGDFYVPGFEVEIGGVGLPRDIVRDIVQLSYNDSVDEIDGFEFVVSNWDAERQSFKYVGAETAEMLEAHEPGSPHRIFEPSDKEIEIWMGYLGDLCLMVKGVITTLEPQLLSESARSTLKVRGLNMLHHLRSEQHTDSWSGKSIGEIVNLVAGKKEFPLPIEVSPKVSKAKHGYVAQENQYDIDFIVSRARISGCVVLLREGDEDAKEPLHKKRRLYFGPSDDQISGMRKVTFHLDWGTGLRSFQPTLTTANQIGSVTVRGWDRKRRKAISQTVKLTDREIKMNEDMKKLVTRCKPREEYVVDRPVSSDDEARELARTILLGRYKELVKATGTCVGLADLRAGQRVLIGPRLGARFSGSYFVTKTTHTIDDQGYVTRFEARRENLDELASGDESQ